MNSLRLGIDRIPAEHITALHQIFETIFGVPVQHHYNSQEQCNAQIEITEGTDCFMIAKQLKQAESELVKRGVTFTCVTIYEDGDDIQLSIFINRHFLRKALAAELSANFYYGGVGVSVYNSTTESIQNTALALIEHVFNQ